ncbi:MAG: hypothetical protein LAP87_00495 [Acidobacteriia bacterium]|nr:hypothetical protein [Terriglobia bacterium]
MFLDRKPFVYLWRPVYRLVFGGVIWPFLGRIKAFFLAETGRQLEGIEARLAILETEQRARFDKLSGVVEALEQKLLPGIEGGFAALEAEQRARFDKLSGVVEALEQKLLPGIEGGFAALEAEQRARFEKLSGTAEALQQRLERLQAELDSSQADRWNAIEQLLIAVMGSSVREGIATADR